MSRIDTASVPRQPDISYHPDRAKWEKRTLRRLAEDPSLLSTALPDGFPKKLSSPLVWEGSGWKNEAQWVFNLTPEHLKEIDDAVKHFHSTGLHFGHISQETFPLPTLAPSLKELARELHYGRGFFVLRTIPVSSYSRADNALIYAGLSSYIAPTRGLQDANGGVLSHIKDLSRSYPKGAIGGPAYTTDKQVFHTDHGSDIVALFALETAAEGGTSRISSSWRVYNELAEKRPDLVKTLAEPWVVDGFGRDPPSIERPLLYYLDSKIIIQYARRYFTGFQGLPRSSNIPPITEAQAEALDALHFLAEKYSLGSTSRRAIFSLSTTSASSMLETVLWITRSKRATCSDYGSETRSSLGSCLNRSSLYGRKPLTLPRRSRLSHWIPSLEML